MAFDTTSKIYSSQVKQVDNNGENIFLKNVEETEKKQTFGLFQQKYFQQDASLLDSLYKMYGEPDFNNEEMFKVSEDLIHKTLNFATSPFNFLNFKLTSWDSSSKIKDKFKEIEKELNEAKLNNKNKLEIIKKHLKELPTDTKIIFNSKPELIQINSLQFLQNKITEAVYAIIKKFSPNINPSKYYCDHFLKQSINTNVVEKYKTSSWETLFGNNVIPDNYKKIYDPSLSSKNGPDDLINVISDSLKEGFSPNAAPVYKNMLILLMDTINNSFKTGKMEVSQKLWDALSDGENLQKFKASNITIFDDFYLNMQNAVQDIEDEYNAFFSEEKNRKENLIKEMINQPGTKIKLLMFKNILTGNETFLNNYPELAQKIINKKFDDIDEKDLEIINSNIMDTTSLSELETTNELKDFLYAEKFEERLINKKILKENNSRMTGNLYENIISLTANEIVSPENKEIDDSTKKALNFTPQFQYLKNTKISAKQIDKDLKLKVNKMSHIDHHSLNPNTEWDNDLNYALKYNYSICNLPSLIITDPAGTETDYIKNNLYNEYLTQLHPEWDKNQRKQEINKKLSCFKQSKNLFINEAKKNHAITSFPFVDKNIASKWNNFQNELMHLMVKTNFVCLMDRLPLLGAVSFRQLNDENKEALINLIKKHFGDVKVTELRNNDIILDNLFITPEAFVENPKSYTKESESQQGFKLLNSNTKNAIKNAIIEKNSLQLEKNKRFELKLYNDETKDISVFDYQNKGKTLNVLDNISAFKQHVYSKQSYLASLFKTLQGNTPTLIGNIDSSYVKFINTPKAIENHQPSIFLHPEHLLNLRFSSSGNLENASMYNIDNHIDAIEIKNNLIQNQINFLAFALFYEQKKKNNNNKNDDKDTDENNNIFKKFLSLFNDKKTYIEFEKFKSEHYSKIKKIVEEFNKLFDSGERSKNKYPKQFTVNGQILSLNDVLAAFSGASYYTSMEGNNYSLLSILNFKRENSPGPLASMDNLNALNEIKLSDEKEKKKIEEELKEEWSSRLTNPIIPVSSEMGEEINLTSYEINNNIEISPQEFKKVGYCSYDDRENFPEMFYSFDKIFEKPNFALDQKELEKINQQMKDDVKKQPQIKRRKNSTHDFI